MTTITTTRRERVLIHDLAAQVAAFAAEPRMAAIRRRWAAVNGLRRPDRAPVWCKPVGCWPELLPQDSLSCTEPRLRQLEYRFRQLLLKREIGDDEPVRPDFLVQPRIEPLGDGPRYGVEIHQTHSQEAGGAWAYDPPLTDTRDIAKLRQPVYSYRKEETEAEAAFLDDLFGDVYPVRIACTGVYGLGTLGTRAAELRGLTQLMMDTALEPEFLHQLMSFLRDDVLHYLDVCESTGCLEPNIREPMTCSDPIGEPQPDGSWSLKNCWCACNSQEWDQVSPAAWETFCLDYQRPIMERFGLVQYGCCENLTQKIDGVLSIPNLRVFVLSAWTDRAKLLDRVVNDHCIMWRQKATDVTMHHDLDRLRHELLDGARQMQGHYYQIVLRELQTLDGHRDRLHVWTRYAIEAAERYA